MFDIKLIIPFVLLLVSFNVLHSGNNASYSENVCGDPLQEYGKISPMGFSLCPTEDNKGHRLMTLVCYLKADEPSDETEKIVNARSVSISLWDKLWTCIVKTLLPVRNFFMAIVCGIGRFCLCILNTLYCIVYILVSVAKGIVLSILWIITRILHTVWKSIDYILRTMYSTIWCMLKLMLSLVSTFWKKIIGEVMCPNQCNVQRLSPDSQCDNDGGYTIKMQKYAKKLWDNKEETICVMGISCGASHGYVCPSECIEVIKDCLCGLIQSLCKCMWEFLLGILSALSNLLMWKDPPRSIACVIYDFLEDIYNLFYNLFASLVRAFKNAWKAFQAYLKKQRCKRQDNVLRKLMKSICLKLKTCVDRTYNFMKKMAPCDPPRRSYYCYD